MFTPRNDRMYVVTGLANPFKPNGISHCYQLEQSISVKGGWVVFFIFIQILKETSVNKPGEPDQTLHFAASDLVLQCLRTSHEKDARLKWVKQKKISIKLQIFSYP